MIALAKALATCGLLFFGGALLTAADDPLITCRIQYRYVGLNVDARCVGECQAAPCTLAIRFEGEWIVYSCQCADGSMSWCPGILLHDHDGIGASCLDLYEPCGWHLEAQCWGYFNGGASFANACSCELPPPIF